MSILRPELWQTPARLPLRQAKLIGGLALFVLGLAVSNFLLYEGVGRFVHGGALALVSLTNFVLAAGSMAPEERGGRALRNAVVPLTGFMLVALFASVVMLRDEIDPGLLLIGALPVLAVALAVALAARFLRRA